MCAPTSMRAQTWQVRPYTLAPARLGMCALQDLASAPLHFCAARLGMCAPSSMRAQTWQVRQYTFALQDLAYARADLAGALPYMAGARAHLESAHSHFCAPRLGKCAPRLGMCAPSLLLAQTCQVRALVWHVRTLTFACPDLASARPDLASARPDLASAHPDFCSPRFGKCAPSPSALLQKAMSVSNYTPYPCVLLSFCLPLPCGIVGCALNWHVRVPTCARRHLACVRIYGIGDSNRAKGGVLVGLFVGST